MEGNNNDILFALLLFFSFLVGSPVVENSQNLEDWRTLGREENSRKPMMIEPNINSKDMFDLMIP